MIPTIARGNPLEASCAITDPATGLKATGLNVSAMVCARRGSTAPIDPTLTADATERTSDISTTTRPYDVEFTGDVITDKLEAFDYRSVWIVFTSAANGFRCEQERTVVPGQSG